MMLLYSMFEIFFSLLVLFFKNSDKIDIFILDMEYLYIGYWIFVYIMKWSPQ